MGQNILKYSKKQILLILCSLASAQSYGIDWDKCSRNVFFRGNGVGIFLSSTSYFFSIGECAMLGINKHDKKVFMSYNHDKIKIDSSLGYGEYLETYAFMSGCNKKDSLKLGSFLQKNYIKSHMLNAQGTYENIESIIAQYGLCK